MGPPRPTVGVQFAKRRQNDPDARGSKRRKVSIPASDAIPISDDDDEDSGAAPTRTASRTQARVARIADSRGNVALMSGGSSNRGDAIFISDDDDEDESEDVPTPTASNTQARTARPADSRGNAALISGGPGNRPTGSQRAFQRSAGVSPSTGVSNGHVNQTAPKRQRPGNPQTVSPGSLTNVPRMYGNMSDGDLRKCAQAMMSRNNTATSSGHGNRRVPRVSAAQNGRDSHNVATDEPETEQPLDSLAAPDEPGREMFGRRAAASSLSSAALSLGPANRVDDSSSLPVSRVNTRSAPNTGGRSTSDDVRNGEPITAKK